MTAKLKPRPRQKVLVDNERTLLQTALTLRGGTYWETDAAHRLCYLGADGEGGYFEPHLGNVLWAAFGETSRDVLQVQEALLAGKAFSDILVRTRAPNYVWSVSGFPRKGPAGDFVGFCGTLSDDTSSQHIADVIASEERLIQTLLEQDSSATIILEAESAEVVYINVAALRMFKLTEFGRPQIKATMLSSLAEDRHRLVQVREGALQTHEQFLKTHAGDSFWASVALTCFEGYPGRGALVKASLADITTRKEAEEAYVAQLELQETLLNSIPSPVFFVDAEGLFLGCNQTFETAWGRPSDSIKGEPPTAVWPVDLAFQFGIDNQTALQSYDMLVTEYPISRPDATVGTFVCTRLSFGKPFAPLGLVGILQDVSDARASENLLKLWALVFQQSSDGFLIADAGHTIVSCNSRFTEISGISESSVKGRTLGDWALVSMANPGDESTRALQKALDTCAPWSGERQARRQDGAVYSEWVQLNPANHAGHVIVSLTDVSDARESQKKIDFLEYYDALTGLPNRATLMDRFTLQVATARRLQSKVAIIVIDLDRFKSVNDSLGFATGDLLLQMVAERLRRCVRDNDTVARLSGDEFAVVLSNLDHSSAVVRVASGILQTLGQEYDIRGTALHVTPSLGISMYPDDGDDEQGLLKNAEAAMQHAKENGRDNYQFYTEDMNVQAYERLELETNLRRAVARDEMQMYYQPQIDLMTGAMVGVEALVRWEHATKGFISPAEFIPLAEETRLIIPLGEWIMEEAMRHVVDWRKKGHAFNVSVNISAVQFHHKNFKEALAAALVKTGARAEWIELEVTEGVVMRNPEYTGKLLASLKDLGFRLSIDDFGTGYSSLSYLSNFVLDELKIDQSFVRTASTSAANADIIRAVLMLGKSLGLSVVAEGIETEWQRDFLKAEGCHIGQGYLYAKPMPATKIEEWLLTQGNNE